MQENWRPEKLASQKIEGVENWPSHQWTVSRIRERGFKDYYIWHNGVIASDGTKAPPNNWVCV